MVLVADNIGQQLKRLPSVTSPMEIPATGIVMGTPASIIARHPPHTDAIELEPLDSVISELILMV
jgi:hypothetical protein